MSSVRKRESVDAAESTVVAATVSSAHQYPRKKIRLLGVPERSAITVLTDARNVQQPAAVLNYLAQFRSQFLQADSTRANVSQISALLLSVAVERRAQPHVSSEALALAHTLFSTLIDTLTEQQKLDLFDDYTTALQKSATDGSGAAAIVWLQRIELLLAEALQRSTALDRRRVLLVVFIARNCLRHAAVSVRACSVQLVYVSVRSGALSAAECDSLLSKLYLCSTDMDYRVREQATHALLQLYKDADNSIKPQHKHYKVVRSWLADSSPAVRSAAIECLLVFAQQLPHVRVPSASDRCSSRLNDDAFAAVCAAMNDLTVHVRAHAAHTLGQFEGCGVGDEFIEQTLDKKLLNTMKVSQTNYRPQLMHRQYSSRGRHQRGGRGGYSRRRSYGADSSSAWSVVKASRFRATGKSLGEDIPVEQEQEEAVISSDACGALVQALEDECSEVRLHGVHSVSVLTAPISWLSARAADCLADMFNDEIAQVRLRAVVSSERLVLHAPLDMHQLLLMLSVLDDGQAASRDAVRMLLSVCRLSDVQGIEAVVRAAVKCIRRFPIDTRAIHKCLKQVGLHHPVFVQAIACELLALHPVFDTPEPSITDQYYVAKLVLVLNACSASATLRALLPDYIWRHYHFLRHDHPQLVTNLQLSGGTKTGPVDQTSSSSPPRSSDSQSVSLKRMYNSLARALELPGIATEHRLQLLDIIVSDFEACSGMFDSDRALACYLADCGRLVRALTTLLQAVQSPAAAAGSFDDALNTLWSDVLRVRLLYASDATDAHKFMSQVEFVLALANRHAGRNSNSSSTTANNSLSALLDRKSPLGSPLLSPTRLQLLPAHATAGEQLAAHKVPIPPLLDARQLHMLEAEVLEPVQLPEDYVIEFVTGMLTSVRLCVLLHNWGNVPNTHLIYTVEYADGTRNERRIQARDIQQTGERTHRIDTHVVLHSNTRKSWTHSAKVQIGVAAALSATERVPLATAAPVKMRPVARL